MNNFHAQQILFILSLLDAQPLLRRIDSLRWLANVSGDPAFARDFSALADSLEACELRSRQLTAAFSQRIQFTRPISTRRAK